MDTTRTEARGLGDLAHGESELMRSGNGPDPLALRFGHLSRGEFEPRQDLLFFVNPLEERLTRFHASGQYRVRLGLSSKLDSKPLLSV